MDNSQTSPMQDYMANYGQRLQSLLDGSQDPQSFGQSQLSPGGGSADPAQSFGAPDQPQAQPAGPAPAGPSAGPAPGGPVSPAGPQTSPDAPGAPPQSAAGVSFKQKWDESSHEQKNQFTTDLEKELAQGNKTIDSAYDDLTKQMGTRPDGKHISRQDKGMLLMEFGLSLMANSGRSTYGTDTAGAIGASALGTMQGYQSRLGAEQSDWDKTHLAIATKKADAKTDLTKQAALEARSESRDERRSARENSQISSTITQPDNSVIAVTKGGGASKLQLPGGVDVKSKPKPPPVNGPGGSGRTYESDRRYKMYMDTYGKDGMGKPLEGDALETVKKRALQFSADPKASTMSDSEMRQMAERSADAFQKSNWAQFRDMTPDQAKQWRDKNADEQFQRLKRGADASQLVPPNPHPAPVGRAGRGSAPGVNASQLGIPGQAAAAPKQFASQADVAAAFKAKKISKGDTVQIGNKTFKVQ